MEEFLCENSFYPWLCLPALFLLAARAPLGDTQPLKYHLPLPEQSSQHSETASLEAEAVLM